jgi:hypothetical protein
VSNKTDIDSIWARIRSLAGEEFQTTRGLPFTYEIVGEAIRPSRAKQNIGKGEFAKALALVPISGPGQIGGLVRGSAYVWAVLHDRRVRRQEW